MSVVTTCTVKLVLLAAIICNVLVKTRGKISLTDFLFKDFLTST